VDELGETKEGLVSSVRIENGVPVLMVGDSKVDLANVRAISLPLVKKASDETTASSTTEAETEASSTESTTSTEETSETTAANTETEGTGSDEVTGSGQ